MPKIMKLTDVGSDELIVLKYIENDDWVLQQKFDGTRIQMQWDEPSAEIFWSNNGIDPVGHAAAKLKLPALEAVLRPYIDGARSLILEGELLIRTGEFVLWDLLIENDNRPWLDRHNHLGKFFGATVGFDHPLIRATPTASTREEKAVLWERIKEAGVEGAVSKLITSTYVPGIRSKEWVKHKLVKSADVVVLSADRTFKPDSMVVHKGSAGLGIFVNGELKKFTAASLIGKDLTIEPGDVVEINYLYLEPGGAPVQPRIVCKRWDAATRDGDKLPEDCDLAQFPAYSREVVNHG